MNSVKIVEDSWTAVWKFWSVREGGKLLHNRVERAACETFQDLTSKKH